MLGIRPSDPSESGNANPGSHRPSWQGAVHAAEALIRAAPEELIAAAAPLVSALIHAHPPTPDDESLAEVGPGRCWCTPATSSNVL
jgi:hypothetical protein